MYTVHAEFVASYNVVDYISYLSNQTHASSAELFILSLADYHKLAVNCVSYSWLNTHDYRVNCSCKCIVWISAC